MVDAVAIAPEEDDGGRINSPQLSSLSVIGAFHRTVECHACWRSSVVLGNMHMHILIPWRNGLVTSLPEMEDAGSRSRLKGRKPWSNIPFPRVAWNHARTRTG